MNVNINILMEVNMPNVNDLLAMAIEETKQLQRGEVFIVRDLFKGYKWNRISRGDRLLLGTLFLNYVNMKHGDITSIDKSPSGQQKYQRMESGRLPICKH